MAEDFQGLDAVAPSRAIAAQVLQGGKIASHLGAGIRHAQLTLKRPGLKKVLAQTFEDRVRAGTAIVHRPLMPYGEFCV